MLTRVLAGMFRRAAPVPAPDNPLAHYFRNNPGRLIHRWHHYFDIYHRHFAAFRGRSPVLLEIGVHQGGSLEMWREYFGPGAQIVGIDVDPRCRQFEDDGIRVLTGDQADRAFLADVRRQYPRVDILIDDGGHTMAQQITTFEEMYAHVQPNGVYLCEDVHSSYLPEFGGGYGRDGTFVQHAKNLVDRLHAWHSVEPDRFRVDGITRSTYAIHFYDSIVVIEKRPMEKPRHSMTGKRSFTPEPGHP